MNAPLERKPNCQDQDYKSECAMYSCGRRSLLDNQRLAGGLRTPRLKRFAEEILAGGIKEGCADLDGLRKDAAAI